jgi:hypothetical protein
MKTLLPMLAALVLLACGEPPGGEERLKQEGTIGAASGPNPNLSDLQKEPPTPLSPPNAEMGPDKAENSPAAAGPN